MTWLLVASLILNLLLLPLTVAAVYYLWKFSRIILLLEDDFSEAIESLEAVEASLEKILGMQLFFDSKEVKLVVQESMAELKTGKLTVNRLIQKFVDRSKQKYVVIHEEELPSTRPPLNQNMEAIDRSMMQQQ